MGILISRFRKTPTTKERLKKLVKNIKDIEEFRAYTQKKQKNIVGRFILFSVSLFICAAVAFYFLYLPDSISQRILYMTPFLFFPFLIVLIKRIITWYFSRKLKRDESRLEQLKEEKKQLLDEVMDKETYKTAKEILQEFAPEQLQKEVARPMIIKPSAPLAENQELRRRTLPPIQSTPQRTFQPISSTPASGWKPGQSLQPTPAPGWKIPQNPPQNVPFTQQRMPIRGPVLPRPILPKERGVMDRLVDFIVGDGPSNRYALICKFCQSHNGMALQEEFEYLAFRCCYCNAINPARKQRPQAPLLPTSASSQDEGNESSPSTSSSDTEENKNQQYEEKKETETELEDSKIEKHENENNEKIVEETTENVNTDQEEVPDTNENKEETNENENNKESS